MSSTRPIAGPTTLVLERLPETPHEPDFVADAPLVGFDAFLPEHRIYGWIRLAADRLTDAINAHAELILVNVQLEHLADGRMEWIERMRLDRDSLVAVRAGGPRGDPARRQHVRLHPLVVQTGPYLIGGYLHARLGVGPHEEIERRAPMVPLSAGWLEHWMDGRRHRQWAGTILFNRLLADAIEPVDEGALEFGVTSYPVRPGQSRPRRPDAPTPGTFAAEA